MAAVTLIEAFLDRRLDTAAALLAPEARLAVPPLQLSCTGAAEVLEAMSIVLDGMADLRYHLRNRFLAPTSVVDEATVTGLVAPAAGGPPRSCRVDLRLIVTMDGGSVSALTLWPDVGALAEALGRAQEGVVDLRTRSQAPRLASALRATLPAGRPGIHAAREPLAPAGSPDAAADDGLDSPTLLPGPAGAPGFATAAAGFAEGAEAERPRRGTAPPPGRRPVPRRTRQVLSGVAGTAMLAACVALVTLVAAGVLRAGQGPGGEPTLARAAASRTPGAAAGTAGSTGRGGDGAGSARATGRGGTATGTAAGRPAGSTPAPRIVDNRVVLPGDVYFDFSSARLTPQARELLEEIAAQAVSQGRRGRVRVDGYTDDVGTAEFNQRLSRRRAEAVAAALRSDLSRLAGTTAAGPGRPGTLSVSATGHGEDGRVAENDSDEHRALNRRVTLTFPPATTT